MKILYITYDGLLDPLGQSQILPYIRGLSEQPQQWTVLSFEKKDVSESFISQMNLDLSHLGIEWLKIPYYQTAFIPLKIFNLMYALGFVLWKNKKYDLIHVRSYMAALLGLFIKKIYHSNFIFDMRGFFPEERVECGLWKKNSFQYKLFKLLERRFIENADTVVVLTQKAKKILEEDPQYPKAKKIVVIPTCVDTTKFTPQKNEKISLSLCYLGSLGTWYCLDEMLSFFHYLKTQYTQASFTLLINWTSLKQLDPKKLHQLNSISGLKIHSCSYDELPLYLSTVELGIFFIKPLASKRASCPTKLGEFLAMGIPLIINKGIGDCDEWIENERLGILVDDFTLPSYQKASTQINHLIEDKEINSRCMNFAKNYLSLQKGISEYKKIIYI